MSSSCWQVSMAQDGFDVPCSKKPVEVLKHSIIFDMYRSIASSKWTLRKLKRPLNYPIPVVANI